MAARFYAHAHDIPDKVVSSSFNLYVADDSYHPLLIDVLLMNLALSTSTRSLTMGNSDPLVLPSMSKRQRLIRFHD